MKEIIKIKGVKIKLMTDNRICSRQESAIAYSHFLSEALLVQPAPFTISANHIYTKNNLLPARSSHIFPWNGTKCTSIVHMPPNKHKSLKG